MNKLDKIIKYVVNENSYYKKILCNKDINNINCFPILKRSDLQINNKNMFSNNYESKYYNQQLLRQSSSGSSGEPVSVFWDYNDWYISNLSLWRKRQQWYDIIPLDKRVVFTLNSYNVIKKESEVLYLIDKNVLSINISNIDNDKQYVKLVEIINEFNPVWFYIQPLFLERLLYFLKKYNLKGPSNLKYIESVGEILEEELKKNASDFFNVPVANMYGSEEMNCIAFECPHHNMHILTDNVYVEVYDGEFRKYGKGDAIITSLNNYAMPLVRYDQGDVIEVIESANCLCGDHSPIISKIYGRKNQFIKIKDYEINPYYLVEIMGEIINTYNDVIKNYRFKYISKEDYLLCEIFIDKKYYNWQKVITDALTELFYKKSFVKDVLLKIRFCYDFLEIKNKRQIIDFE